MANPALRKIFEIRQSDKTNVIFSLQTETVWAADYVGLKKKNLPFFGKPPEQLLLASPKILPLDFAEKDDSHEASSNPVFDKSTFQL
jgi:hypothetical protein